MAKLKRAKCWRYLERPYTRISRYREKNYVRGAPVCIIPKFELGSLKDEEAKVKVHLAVDRDIQVRQNALEAVRQQVLRVLNEKVGNLNYKLIVRAYPHHILRENKLAGTNKAERLQTGMQLSFGSPVGRAVQAKKGKVLITVLLKDENKVDLVKEAFESSAPKLPCGIETKIERIKA